MRLSFFSLPKPRQFNYPPRYYDEEKERAEKRKKELENSGEMNKSDFGERLTSGWSRYQKSDKARQKKASISVIIYLFIAVLLLYFIFFS